MNFPIVIKFAPDGTLAVCNYHSDDVYRVDRHTGEVLDPFISSGLGGLDGPSDILFHPDGFALVSSNRTDRILQYDSMSGNFLGTFVGC